MREMKDSGVEWIGEIPEQWQVCAVKNLCSMEAGKSLSADSIREEGSFPVYGGNGVRGFYSDYNCDGAVILVGRQGALCGNVHITYGRIWATEHAVITRNYSITDLKYLYYLLTAMELNQYVTTVAAQPGLAVGTIKTKKTVLPPIIEQKKIGKYLNGVCVKIDSIIKKQQTIIEKLKEYKLSFITSTVMGGLKTSAEMKSSGIEYWDKIPSNWRAMQIRHLFRLCDEKNYKSLEEVNLLSLYTDFGVFPHGEQEERGNKAVKAEGYKIVHADDIVVNIILAWMGAIGRSAYDGVTSPAYDIYRPVNGTCSRYYHYLFRTKLFSGECYKYGRGIMAMRWRTYSSEFKSIKVPVPSYTEQVEIADYLDERCVLIDKTIADRNKAINKLEDYKKSLIYEIVTGKREVL